MKITDRDGNPVAADAPTRAIWYSATCGYWTDDWDKLKKVGPGIPCCPSCHCPGCITDAADWDNGVTGYDQEHPGYLAFITASKEKCFGRNGFMKAFKEQRGQP